MEVPISLKTPEKGEWKAHTCANADYVNPRRKFVLYLTLHAISHIAAGLAAPVGWM